MQKQQPAAEKSRRYLAASRKTLQGKQKMASLITKETNILDIVQDYPEAVPVLIEAGLHCIGCQLSMFDTVEQGCAIHGMDGETVEKLVKEMNERVRNFRK